MVSEDDFDPDDDSEYGTENKLGEIGPFELYDDGALDADISVRLDGYHLGLNALHKIRRKCGDAVFMDLLSGVTEEGEPEPDDFEFREPVAQKCSGCNETFPRTMLEHGKCPECGDHDGGN